MLSDWELWACAQQYVTRFGDDAAIHAAQRCDALVADGDHAGHRIWMIILERIENLTGVVAGEIRH